MKNFCIADILFEDYTNKVSLKCKKNAGPVAVTIETTQGNGGSLASKVATKFSYAKFNVDKGQLAADGAKALETSLSLTPEVKLTFKASKGADLGVDYVKGNFYATGSMDVVQMSSIDTSACLGLAGGFKIGGEAMYSMSGKTLSGFNVGASYTHGPIFASVTATSKLSQYNVGLLYKVSNDLTIASQTTHCSAKKCDVLGVGGAYKVSNLGTIKAKVDMKGVVSAALIREIAPKVILTASGTMLASDASTFKPGLSIVM